MTDKEEDQAREELLKDMVKELKANSHSPNGVKVYDPGLSRGYKGVIVAEVDKFLSPEEKAEGLQIYPGCKFEFNPEIPIYLALNGAPFKFKFENTIGYATLSYDETKRIITADLSVDVSLNPTVNLPYIESLPINTMRIWNEHCNQILKYQVWALGFSDKSDPSNSPSLRDQFPSLRAAPNKPLQITIQAPPKATLRASRNCYRCDMVFTGTTLICQGCTKY